MNDEWINGRGKYEWMDEWINGRGKYEWMDEWIGAWIGGRMGEWKDQ